MAPFFVFAAGVASSIGPCVAPRFIAVTSCITGQRRPIITLAAFLGGLIGTYMLFGLAASLISDIVTIAPLVYALVAVGLVVGGILTLARAKFRDHDHDHEDDVPARPRSLIRTALFGASFALVISPCCTPMIAVIVAYTSLVGHPIYGSLLLAVFGIGHSVPLLCYGLVDARFSRWVSRFSFEQALQIASGTMMLVLGAFYLVLV
jgi:cytochrome c-type biogenesis protein